MKKKEVEKNNSYDSWWLRKDMENMGYTFEYCIQLYKELYNCNLDRKKYINKFMKSLCRHAQETGHPKLLSQAAIDTMEDYIKEECNNEYQRFKGDKEPKDLYIHYQMYWIGWMYAYIHYEKDLTSSEIIDILPLNDMIEFYHLGHELDKEVFLSKIEYKFK